jgi:transposase
LADQSGEHVIADRAYDSDRLRAHIAELGAVPVIPPHPCRRRPIAYDRHLYKERHVVECFIGKLKDFRRIATRYDKTLLSFQSLILLAAIVIGLR